MFSTGNKTVNDSKLSLVPRLLFT